MKHLAPRFLLQVSNISPAIMRGKQEILYRDGAAYVNRVQLTRWHLPLLAQYSQVSKLVKTRCLYCTGPSIFLKCNSNRCF